MKKENYMHCKSSCHDWFQLFEKKDMIGFRERPGTFDVCLARAKNCPAYIVRPHAAHLMIDRTIDHFCLFWPSAD